MDLLNEVKERLDIKDNSQDKKIQGYIDDITNKIKSICNRIDFPEELSYLAVIMLKIAIFITKIKIILVMNSYK